MEQAIISLVGLGLVLMLYLDRGHRTRFERMEERFERRFERLEEKLEKKIEDSARRTDARINELNRSVIELAQSVGRVEGRSDVLAAVE